MLANLAAMQRPGFITQNQHMSWEKNEFVLCKHQRDDRVVWFGQRSALTTKNPWTKETRFINYDSGDRLGPRPSHPLRADGQPGGNSGRTPQKVCFPEKNEVFQWLRINNGENSWKKTNWDSDHDKEMERFVPQQVWVKTFMLLLLLKCWIMKYLKKE